MFSAELVDPPALEQEEVKLESVEQSIWVRRCQVSGPTSLSASCLPKNLQQFRAICQQYVYKKQETKKLSVCLLVVSSLVIFLLFKKEVKY